MTTHEPVLMAMGWHDGKVTHAVEVEVSGLPLARVRAYYVHESRVAFRASVCGQRTTALALVWIGAPTTCEECLAVMGEVMVSLAEEQVAWDRQHHA